MLTVETADTSPISDQRKHSEFLGQVQRRQKFENLDRIGKLHGRTEKTTTTTGEGEQEKNISEERSNDIGGW